MPALETAARRLPWAAPTPDRPLAIAVSDTTLAIEFDDQETRVVRRTTTASP